MNLVSFIVVDHIRLVMLFVLVWFLVFFKNCFERKTMLDFVTRMRPTTIAL
jgi:hypothetical protein